MTFILCSIIAKIETAKKLRQNHCCVRKLVGSRKLRYNSSSLLNYVGKVEVHAVIHAISPDSFQNACHVLCRALFLVIAVAVVVVVVSNFLL